MEFPEAEYRRLVQETLARIERAFETVDPDLAECDQAHGALTIRMADGSRCILSAQPSVRQIWLALAARGTAYHFNYDPERREWRDDKGRDIELRSFLRGYLKETIRQDVAI